MSGRPGPVTVLVHGSFHGAWAFEKVSPYLVRAGHQVVARDLPGHGLRARLPRSYVERGPDPGKFAAEPSPIAGLRLRDFADQVVTDIRQLAEQLPGRRIVVVGHSFAGLVLNVVGETVPHLLDRLVYLAGFMTAHGRSADDYLAGAEFAGSKLPSVSLGDPAETGALRIDPRSTDPEYQARLKATFAGDIDDGEWEAVAHLLTPDIPLAPHGEPALLTRARWGAVPRTYIRCTADSGIPPRRAGAVHPGGGRLQPGQPHGRPGAGEQPFPALVAAGAARRPPARALNTERGAPCPAMPGTGRPSSVRRAVRRARWPRRGPGTACRKPAR